MLLKESTSFFSSLISNKKYLLFLFFYSFLLLFFCSSFSPLYFFNIWPDVNVYYTIGKGLFFDKVPYKDLFDHKGPIIFFIYAVGYIISPNSFLGMYIIESVFLFVSLSFVYLLIGLFFDKKLSLINACSFPFFLFSYTAFGGSAEEFILSFIIISLYFFIKYFKYSGIDHNPKIMFLHGILLSITFFIKLNLIIFWLFPLFAIFFIFLFHKEYKLFILNFIALVFGSLFISAIILYYFFISKAISDFIEGYFHLNSLYGKLPSSSFYEYFYALLSRIIIVFKGLYLSSFLAILGAFSFTIFPLLNKKTGRISILLCFCSTIIVLFTSQAVMLYYYIIYCAFIPLGLISFLYYLRRFTFFFRFSNILFFSLIILSFFLTISQKITLGSIFDSKEDNSSLYNVFATEIDENNIEEHTLLCLGLDYSINVFTKLQIVPNVKYFFTPNIGPDLYPLIYNEQLSYIKSKSINYILMKDTYRYKYIFENTLEMSGFKAIKSYKEFTLYKKGF